jgi:iron(III) transport system substrate-binding protein
VAGVGILESSKNKETALKLIDFLTSEEAQKYFAEATYEYPLVKGVKANQALPPLEDIDTPDIDLSDLSDLENTLKLLRKVGIL